MLCAAHHSAQPAHDLPSQKSPAQSTLRTGADRRLHPAKCLHSRRSNPTTEIAGQRRSLRDHHANPGGRPVTVRTGSTSRPSRASVRQTNALLASSCFNNGCSFKSATLHPNRFAVLVDVGGNSRRGPAAGKPAATSPAHRNQRHHIPIGLHATKRHRENLIRQELPPRQEAVSVDQL